MDGRLLRCSIGRSGIGQKRGEGDGITPEGRFRILGWMGRADRLGPLPQMRAIGPSSRWSDDPSDPKYNQPSLFEAPRFSSERLHRPDHLYDLVGILDYNLPTPVSGRGSAIFVHVWRAPLRPTEGCIAFSHRDIRWILQRWRPWDRVVVRGAKS